MFSVFEVSSWWNLSLNWVALFLVLVIFPTQYWIMGNNIIMLVKLLLLNIFSSFKAVTSLLFGVGSLLIPVSLFISIVIINISGLLPYVFTPTAHLVVTLSFALPLWLGGILCGWIKNTTNMFAHLVPTGTPGALMSFMVLIELVSSLIRPITLSVRLAANMIAGHLLLTLVSSSMNNLIYAIFSLIGVIVLLVLESAVAFIQAYVFSILSVLYAEELSSVNMI